MEENKMAKGLVLGFLTGGVVGAALALLYAPKSGKELRSDIKHRTDDFIDDTSEYMQIAKEKASDLINEGKKKSEKLIKDAKERAGTLIEDANELLNEAKDKASHKYEDAKGTIASEKERVKDALKAGVDAYKEEKSKKKS